MFIFRNNSGLGQNDVFFADFSVSGPLETVSFVSPYLNAQLGLALREYGGSRGNKTHRFSWGQS